MSFAKQYSSVCFKTPEGITDWSNYGSIVIDYTVNQVGAASSTLGLQVCPIYADATGSWVEVNGHDTARITEQRYNLSGSGTITFPLTGHDFSSVGRLMFGVFDSPDFNEDVITIHSIKLLPLGASDGFPEKEDTLTYSKPIHIENRDSVKRILCSDKNIPYMYDPNENSSNLSFYPEESAVPKATVIRAMSVDKDGNQSDVVTKVFFVGNDLKNTYKNASVISIVTDPDNLLSVDKGIYRYGNWEASGKESERPADVTYIDEDGTIPFDTTMGIRIHGGYSRRWGQKSFNLYFRDELGGLKNLKNYQLIPGAVNSNGEETTKYKNFMIRNGGNDYSYTKIQDVWIQSLVGDRSYTTQAARPCVLFLNGEYWGLYNLTEKYSDNYIETEFGVDKDNVVMFKNGSLDEGLDSDEILYQDLQSYAYKDMSNTANFEEFKQCVDYQSYLDYYATELYI